MRSKAGQLICPRCSAETVQSLEVIFESGSSTGRSATVGAAAVSGGAAYGAAVTTSRQRTLLAEKFAPPERPQAGKFAGCFATIICFATFVVVMIAIGFSKKDTEPPSAAEGFLLFFLPIFAWALSFGVLSTVPRQSLGFERRLKEYEEALARWQQSYHCSRCGNVFEWTPRDSNQTEEN